MPSAAGRVATYTVRGVGLLGVENPTFQLTDSGDDKPLRVLEASLVTVDCGEPTEGSRPAIERREGMTGGVNLMGSIEPGCEATMQLHHAAPRTKNGVALLNLIEAPGDAPLSVEPDVWYARLDPIALFTMVVVLGLGIAVSWLVLNFLNDRESTGVLMLKRWLPRIGVSVAPVRRLDTLSWSASPSPDEIGDRGLGLVVGWRGNHRYEAPEPRQAETVPGVELRKITCFEARPGRRFVGDYTVWLKVSGQQSPTLHVADREIEADTAIRLTSAWRAVPYPVGDHNFSRNRVSRTIRITLESDELAFYLAHVEVIPTGERPEWVRPSEPINPD